MTRMLAAAFLAAIFAYVSGAASAQEADPNRNLINSAARTETIRFHSEILDEERVMHIRWPEYYEPGAPYPTVYVSDGENNFDLVADFLEYLSREWKRLPDMIVVGLENVNRNRDFVPRVDPNFPNTGEGERFIDFTVEEWVAEVERRHGGRGPRILFGHSFGGVYAINTLMTRPDAFDAYIAVGTSTWVADRVMFDIANEAFDEGRRLDAWLYHSVAEADGGATVPDGDLFAQLLRDRAPAELDWTYEIIPETTHFSAVPPSLHNAFMALFPVWGQDAQLGDRIRREGPPAIDAWFAQHQERLGYRFFPQDWDMMILAYGLAREGHVDGALALIRRMQREYPLNPSLVSAEGDILQRDGRRDAALSAYDRALALMHAIDYHGNSIESLTARRDRLAAR